MYMSAKQWELLKTYNFALYFLVHAANGDVSPVFNYREPGPLLNKALVVGTPAVQKELLKLGVDINTRPVLEDYFSRYSGDESRFHTPTFEEELWKELGLGRVQTALERACEKGNFQQAAWLLEQGADIKQVSFLELYRPEAVLWLVKHGADVNQTLRNDRISLLHYAFLQPTFDLLNELLLRTAEFTKPEERCILKIWKAVKDGDMPAFQQQWRPNEADLLAQYMGETFLLYCIRRNLIAFVDFLLKAGVDPNEKDCMGQRPLTVVLNTKNKEMLRWLLCAGADVHMKDSFGRDALIQAKDKKAGQEIIALLEEASQK